MTEGVEQVQSEAPGPSAGTLLREAREAAGLHIAALAVSLKVPVRKLEALEADRFDILPDAVFVRGLASSVCRTLKIDPLPILSRLPQTSVPRLIQDDNGINAPFRAPGDSTGPSWRDQLSRPVFLAVFALLVGALVVIFLPPLQREENGAAVSRAEPVMPPPVMAPVEPPVIAQAAPAPAPVLPPAAAAPAQAPVPVASVPLALVVPVPAKVSSAAAAAAAPASLPAAPKAGPSAGAAPVPAAGTVVFRATGDSWVEVTDAKGVVTLRKLLASGETVGASGSLPLTVVVGRANATQVQVRGKPFDMGPVSRDNVARFEVK